MTPAQMAEIHGAAFATPPPWSEAEIIATLHSPGAFAISESQGFLLGRVIAGEAELVTLAVHPDARRQGIARRLVAGFLARAEAGSAFLEVAADNTAAIALYAQAGFVPCGRRRAYYRAPDGSRTDAIVMARTES